MTVHDFKTQLAYSEDPADEAIWRDFYKQAFPDMVNFMRCTGDTLSQRAGTDTVIHCANNKTLTVDEKKRRGVWHDFLLEFISNDRTGAPGWIEKPLTCDYIAYAFMDIRKCYLLPWPMLRHAWRINKHVWLKERPIKTAKNRGYNTLSVAIPIHELRTAISVAGIINLS